MNRTTPLRANTRRASSYQLLLAIFVAIATSALGACSHRQRAEGRAVLFSGMCDASGAVPLSARTFAVADDEDNVIRVYDAERGGAPLSAVDLSPMLQLPAKGKSGKRAPELDIEAATRLGDLAIWLTSHGRNSKGKLKPERRRLFATSLSADGALRVVGEPYETLLDDMLADPRYAQLGLAEASERAPKSEGGLNMEGMTARRGGGLLIGFRSPIVSGKALVATLLNPEQVVRGEQPAQFGPPLFVALGGLGVRGLSAFGERYLILAGDVASERRSVLYTWNGNTRVQPVQVALGELNPEAFFSPDERAELLLLSDDGTEEIAGVPCKELKTSHEKRFRGLWVQASKLPR